MFLWRSIAVEGFIHISKLGWGYYEFNEKNLTMTSREEMAQVRVGDRVVVSLEEVDLENRRMSFVLESNLERRLIKGGRKSSGRFSRRGSRQGWRPYQDGFDDFVTDFDEDDDDWDE